MKEQESKTKEKTIGAYIKYSCSDELDMKLRFLAEYQERNNIERIDWYYTSEDGDFWAYYKAIADIFEESIDSLLVVGDIEELTQDEDIQEKIKQNVELIKV